MYLSKTKVYNLTMPESTLKPNDPLDNKIAELEKKLSLSSNKRGFMEELKNDGLFDLYDIYPDEQYNDSNESAEMVDSEILISKATTYLDSNVGFEANFEPLISLEVTDMKELVEELANDLLTLGYEDANLKGKIFLLLLCLLVQPKTKLYMIKILSKLLKEEEHINIHVLSYFYALGLLTNEFAKDLLLKAIEKNNLEGFRILITNIGVELRLRNAKAILELQDEIANLQGFEEYGKEIKKLRNNLIEESKIITEIKDIKEKLKTRLKKYGELRTQLKLVYDIELLKTLDSKTKNWWKQLVVKKQESEQDQAKTLLVKKYQKTIDRLNLSNDKQVDVLLLILQSDNFAVAAKNLNSHLLKEKNYNDAFFVIVELLFYEKKLNRFYVYLLRDLLRLSKTVQLKLKKFIWMFYSNKLNEDYNEANMKLFIDFIIEIVFLDFYGLKIIRGFDFFTDQPIQRAFNKDFISKMIHKADRRFILNEMKKLGGDKKNAGLIQDLKDYIEEYIDNELNSADASSRIELSKLELIKDFEDYAS